MGAASVPSDRPPGSWTGPKLLVLVGLVFLVQWVCLFPSMGTASLGGVEDEGTVALNGSRILHGELPYGDYFTTLTPGTDALVALWFGLWGESLSSLRAYFFFGLSLTAALIFWISARLLPRGWSEVPALLFLCLGGQAWPAASPHWDGCLWALVSLLLLSGTRWLAAGLATGLTALVLQTIGAGVAAACTLCLLLARRDGRRRALCLYWLGVALPWGAFGLWLLSLGLAHTFWYDTVIFNTTRYVEAQGTGLGWSLFAGHLATLTDGLTRLGSLPWGVWLSWFCRAAGFVTADLVSFSAFYPVCAVALGMAVLDLRRSSGAPQTGLLFPALAFTLALVGLLDLSRPNRYHLAFHTPLLYPLEAVLLCRLAASGPRARRGVLAFTSLVCLGFLAHGADNLSSWATYRFPVPYPRGTLWENRPERAAGRWQVAQAVRARCQGDSLFAFPHAPLTTWLLGKRNPTPFVAALPAFYTWDQFRLCREALERDRTPCLLYRPVAIHPGDYPRLDPARYQQEMEALRDFLTQGYSPCLERAGWVVYCRTSP